MLDVELDPVVLDPPVDVVGAPAEPPVPVVVDVLVVVPFDSSLLHAAQTKSADTTPIAVRSKIDMEDLLAIQGSAWR